MLRLLDFNYKILLKQFSLFNQTKNLAIVSSPFQLLCLFEYLILMKHRNISILCFYDSQIEKNQLIKVSEFYNSHEIKLRKATKLIQFVYPFTNLFSRPYNLLVIGNYFTRLHRVFVKLTSYKKLILVDDGSITLKLEDSFKNSQFEYPFNKTNLFDKLLKINNHFDFDLFSIFDLEPNRYFKISKNSLTYTKNIVQNYSFENSVLIIGQPLVEKNFLSETIFFEFIKNIKNKYKNYRKIYYPSRKESELKLKLINEIYGFEIINPDQNIELYFIQIKTLPSFVIGITSSALITINEIFKRVDFDIQTNYCRINFLNKKYSDFSKAICNEFDRRGIKRLII